MFDRAIRQSLQIRKRTGGQCVLIMLAPFIARWRALGYEVIVTADHGQDERGHHGGRGPLQQEAALYYFGEADGPSEDTVIDQLQLAPTILSRLGADIPKTMKAKPFLS